MEPDKFTAVWVSHSSISDFLKCPRAYYLNNVYKDPDSGHKISIMSPPLALGQTVHEVLESLSILPTEKRFSESLIPRYEQAWQKITGKQGGFSSPETEQQYKERGKKMLQRVMDHPGPLKNLAVKIKKSLPYFWLSEEDNIILCGKVDWLEYLPDTDRVHIIDFKTSKRDESPKSLQLPIYYLLVANCQKRAVANASYWYIERNDAPSEVELPDIDDARKQVLKIAQEIRLARKLNRFKCPRDTGCYACKPFEAIVQKRAQYVGVNDYKQDVYVIDSEMSDDTSMLL